MDNSRSTRTLIAVFLLLAAAFVAVNSIVTAGPLASWWLPVALFIIGVALALSVWFESRPSRIVSAPMSSVNEPGEASSADSQARSDAISAAVPFGAGDLARQTSGVVTEAPIENINISDNVGMAQSDEISGSPTSPTTGAASITAAVSAGAALAPSAQVSSEATDAAPPKVARVLAEEGTDIAAAKRIDVTESPLESGSHVPPPTTQTATVTSFVPGQSVEPAATPSETEVQKHTDDATKDPDKGPQIPVEREEVPMDAPAEPTPKEDAGVGRQPGGVESVPETKPADAPAPKTPPSAKSESRRREKAAPATSPSSAAQSPTVNVSPAGEDDTQARSDTIASSATPAQAAAVVPAGAPPTENININAGMDDADAGEIGGRSMETTTASSAPTIGGADDLTRIDGIGVKMASALKSAGIDTFSGLAATNEEALRAAIKAAGMRFAPTMPTWAEQAGYAARGDWAGLETFIGSIRSRT